MALFGKKNTADFSNPRSAVESILNAVQDGNIEMILSAFQVNDGIKNRVLGLPSMVRSYIGNYGKKLFKGSSYRVGNVQEDGDRAVVSVSGTGVDGRRLTQEATAVLSTRGKEIGLFSGKRDLKTITQAMGMVGDIVDRVQYAPVQGDITLVHDNGKWKITNRDQLTNVLVGVPASEFIPAVVAKVKQMRG